MEDMKDLLKQPKETSQKQWPPAGIDWYYSDENTAIALGDCKEILPELPKVDLVLTDPPYGIGGGSGTIGKSRRSHHDYESYVDSRENIQEIAVWLMSFWNFALELY